MPYPYWVVSLNLLTPKVVTGPGRYVTRGGDTVTVSETDSQRAFGKYQDGIKERWTLSGRVLPTYESTNDIVAKSEA